MPCGQLPPLATRTQPSKDTTAKRASRNSSGEHCPQGKLSKRGARRRRSGVPSQDTTVRIPESNMWHLYSCTMGGKVRVYANIVCRHRSVCDRHATINAAKSFWQQTKKCATHLTCQQTNPAQAREFPRAHEQHRPLAPAITSRCPPCHVAACAHFLLVCGLLRTAAWAPIGSWETCNSFSNASLMTQAIG